MKLVFKILVLITSAFCAEYGAQTKVYKDHSKWGIKEKDAILIAPVYDSIFNFDKEGKVCLACFKIRTVSANKIMKTVNIAYHCNYLNKQNAKLMIKNRRGDTCSVFELHKNSLLHYTDNPNSFVVAAKGKHFLIDKNFNQLTMKGYYNIWPSVDPNFYIVETMDENENVHTGLIDKNENEVIPYMYSNIKINPVDSFIVGCTAGLGPNGVDDVFDYKGKKINSYHRHVELATKNFIIQKVFEPKEHFIFYNIKTKEEKSIQASEIHFYEHDQILVKIKSDWFIYDLVTNEKKETQY